MTFYTYFAPERPELPQPCRVYVNLDSTEPDSIFDTSNFTAYFEAVDADAFDTTRIDQHSISFNILDKAVSVVEVELTHCTKVLFEQLFPKSRPSSEFIEDSNGDNNANGDQNDEGNDDEPNYVWYELVFEDSGQIQVKHYLNLFFGEPIWRTATIAPVSAVKSRQLESAFSIDNLPDATSSQIETALSIRGDDGSVVYDVGQGNCNAIVNAMAQPLVYYDFGGGVLSHTKTYPTGLSKFCFTKCPSIVLSHWDWDHWSSAKRTQRASSDPIAIAAKWIVPRQKLGPVHRGFAAQLNNLLIWPRSLPQVSTPNVAVQSCLGPKGTRNHSGLSMVFKPSWARGNGVLFTGDCDYRYISAATSHGGGFDCVVIPHHGAKLSKKTTIPPPQVSSSYLRLCVSCGKSNDYGHPDGITITDHVSSGWTRGNHLFTYDRQPTKLGHAGHIWLSRRVQGSVTPACRFRLCDTELVQN